ncbi:MAG: hypothetical protein CFE44_13500 [Burkholderiales bacterium PBB4]|nr:MAG: hypothetical protein CFE44_13500 [Burkholderiales bacterium PBB4]
MRFTRVIFRSAVGGLFAGAFAVYAHAQTAVYFDGGTPRTLTLEPGLRADFRAVGSPSARTAGGQGPFVTLVDTTRPGAQSMVGSHSSVYREGTSPAGRLMALPGGVVVNFKPEWSPAQIQAWALEGGYVLGSKMNILGHWYTIKTAAGNASLETANAIQRSGAVVSATPNWWIQTVAR